MAVSKKEGAIKFDGYLCQPVALFDEFRAANMPYKELLELIDRNGTHVDVKYGTALFRPQLIFLQLPKHRRLFMENDFHSQMGHWPN